MSAPTSSSRAVNAGVALVTLVLALTVVFGVLAIASVVVGTARHGDSLLYGDSFRVPLQLSPEDVGPLPAGVESPGWVDVDVEVPDPTTRQMWLRSAMDFGSLVLLLSGLWLGRRFLRSVQAGDPFGAANVGRLRAIGFLLVVGAPIVAVIDTSLRTTLYSEIPSHPSVELGVAGFALPGSALLGGLGAFILAEVFAHGSRLREDVEATI